MLHLTKVAFGCTSFDDLVDHMAARVAARRPVELTTRNCPKRLSELAGGSLYWILKHQLVARSALLGFAPNDEGRWTISLDPELVLVQPQPRRAHQGWRYLEADAAPRDAEVAGAGSAVLPRELAAELRDIGLF